MPLADDGSRKISLEVVDEREVTSLHVTRLPTTHTDHSHLNPINNPFRLRGVGITNHLACLINYRVGCNERDSNHRGECLVSLCSDDLLVLVLSCLCVLHAHRVPLPCLRSQLDSLLHRMDSTILRVANQSTLVVCANPSNSRINQTTHFTCSKILTNNSRHSVGDISQIIFVGSP